MYEKGAAVRIMSDLRRWVTGRDKLAFQRLSTGLYYHQKEDIRFLTLTNIPGNKDFKRQVRDFKSLLRWARNKFGSIEYFAVHTAEGNGVFHAIITGPFIPKKILVAKWRELTGAYMIKIKFVMKDGQNLPHTKMYHEMTCQRCVLRYSHSRGWLKPHSISVWENLKDMMKDSYMDSAHWYRFTKKAAVDFFQDWLLSDLEYPDYSWSHLHQFLWGSISNDYFKQ
jgi:hypothetical protein